MNTLRSATLIITILKIRKPRPREIRKKEKGEEVEKLNLTITEKLQ